MAIGMGEAAIAARTSSSKTVDSSVQALLVYRHRQAQQQVVVPVSSPPSWRKPEASSNHDLSTPLSSSPSLVRGLPTASTLVALPERRRADRGRYSATLRRTLPPVSAWSNDRIRHRGECQSQARTLHDHDVHRKFHNARCTTTSRTDPSRPLRGPKLSVKPLHPRPAQAASPNLLFLGVLKRRNAATGEEKEAAGWGEKAGVLTFSWVVGIGSNPETPLLWTRNGARWGEKIRLGNDGSSS